MTDLHDSGDAKTPGEPAHRGGFLRGMSPRFRWLLGTAITVVVLAAVILGVSALSAPSESGAPQTASTTPAEQSQAEYQSALAALASGDTTKAVDLLESAVSLDASNTAAVAKLDEVKRKITSNSGGDSAAPSPDDPAENPNDSSNAPAEDPAFLKAVKDLRKLLPDSADGYELGTPSGAGADMAVSGNPTVPEAATRSLWTVHDRKTASGAEKYVKSVSKSLYTKNAEDLKVDGASAYFATDGTRFASVVYVRGRYVFEVVLTRTGAPPAELRDEAVKASQAFPDEL